MPYTLYKGALLTNEEYERVKDELEQKEQEYLKLLLGEELESKEGYGEASPSEPAQPAEPAEATEASREPVGDQEAHPKADGSETTDSEGSSGESEVRQVRRKRQK